RNVDYLDNDDEFYSDDHLYYKEDGYVAFSDYSDDWEMFGDKNKLEMVFIPDDRHIKRKLRNIPNKGIIMDPFNKLSRNVDYLDNDDEFYSDDHLYYKEDGYVAFSDYS
ncbi:sce7725 family protein, partial [Staphylococcus aureus]